MNITRKKRNYIFYLFLILFIYCISVSFILLGVHSFMAQTLKYEKQTILQNKTSYESKTKIQKNIAKQIIRLHVIANSDSQKDQQLKLMVRNHIIDSLRNSIHPYDSIQTVKKCLSNKRKDIQAMAQWTIYQKGFDYPVNVQLCQQHFPEKTYGDMTFPAGTYQALCVKIGKAKGHNWWCVLYPSLCFVNETTAVVPKNSKEKLKRCLSEEEYAALLENKAYLQTANGKKSVSVEYHSALYDLLHH